MMKAMISKGMNFTQFGQNSSMQLSLCDESETKNDDDDKHKDHKVRDTKATGKSTEQACNVSNPTHLVTGSSVLNEILTYPKPDQQKKETRGGYKVQSHCKSSASWERRNKQRGKRKKSIRKSDKRKAAIQEERQKVIAFPISLPTTIPV